MPKLEFTPYASSSSGNVYTLSDGQTKLMIECGLPWPKIQRLLKFRTLDIAGVLSTHGHMDHCKGLPGAAKAGLDVYASSGTLAAVGLTGHHRAHEITAGAQCAIGTFTVMPFRVEHDCAGESLGFLLASGEERFLFLTDSAYVKNRFRNLSGIAIEANYCPVILGQRVASGAVIPSMRDRLLLSHFSIDNVLEFLRANDLSKVREIFLLHLSDGNSNEEEFKRKAQAATGKPVMVCAA